MMIKTLLFVLFIVLSNWAIFAQASVHQLPMSALPMDKNVVYMTIKVTLNEPATVEVYRGKHLVYSEAFKAGHHIINPAAMPMGAYQVKVAIVREGKTVRSFKQYYLKEIPPPSQIQTSLNVQLLEPATVKVLKDDQLLYHLKFQEAGFYKIDTGKFPPGTYPVTIEVKNDKGTYQYHQVVVFRKMVRE